MKSTILRACGFLLAFTLICGVFYTGVVTAAAQIFFPKQANGSLITENGVVVGSELIGQPFSGEKHMWGRPGALDTSTFTDENGEIVLYGAPSNLSPASEGYEKLIAERVAGIKAAHPEMGDTPIPSELVTNSASGLDPHISPAAAEYQAQRIANANNIELDKVLEIIKKCTSGRVLGVFGEETVNVLKVNLMLDNL